MKIKSVATIAISTALLGTLAFSAEISWTGGGTTAAWDDTGNWGGSLPTASDIAVISGVVPATRADITTMNGFGGVKIDGEESKIAVYGITSSVTMTVPLSGTGTFSVTNSSNNAYLTLNNDNSSFSGSFFTDNAGMTLSHANAFGNSDTKFLVKNGTNYKYFQVGTGGKCKSFAGTLAFMSAEVYLRPSGGFDYTGTVDIRSGTVNIRNDAGEVYMSRYSGLVTNTTTSSSEFRLTNNHRLTSTGVIALGRSWINLFSNAKLYLAGQVASAASITINNGSLIFEDQYRLSPRQSVAFGNQSYPLQGKMDLKGFDQWCGRLTNYDQKHQSTDSTSGYLTSSTAPATFTVLGDYESMPDNSDRKTKEQKQRFVFPVQGHASFELNSTNLATATTIRFSSPRSNTDGSLFCRRGTIVLESTCAFTNLSSIVASSEGQITVEAGAAINPKATLDLSDSAVFTVGEGCVVTVETAKVGSKWLKPAEYVCDEAGRPNLAGAGKLRVMSDGTPPGISVIIR